MKVKIVGYIHTVAYPWQDKVEYVIMAQKVKQAYYACVSSDPIEVEVEVPDNFDPRPQYIEALEEKKRELKSEFAKQVTMLDEQIKKHLAIAA